MKHYEQSSIEFARVFFHIGFLWLHVYTWHQPLYKATAPTSTSSSSTWTSPSTSSPLSISCETHVPYTHCLRNNNVPCGCQKPKLNSARLHGKEDTHRTLTHTHTHKKKHTYPCAVCRGKCFGITAVGVAAWHNIYRRHRKHPAQNTGRRRRRDTRRHAWHYLCTHAMCEHACAHIIYVLYS